MFPKQIVFTILEDILNQLETLTGKAPSYMKSEEGTAPLALMTDSMAQKDSLGSFYQRKAGGAGRRKIHTVGRKSKAAMGAHAFHFNY